MWMKLLLMRPPILSIFPCPRTPTTTLTLHRMRSQLLVLKLATLARQHMPLLLFTVTLQTHNPPAHMLFAVSSIIPVPLCFIPTLPTLRVQPTPRVRAEKWHRDCTYTSALRKLTRIHTLSKMATPELLVHRKLLVSMDNQTMWAWSSDWTLCLSALCDWRVGCELIRNFFRDCLKLMTITCNNF